MSEDERSGIVSDYQSGMTATDLATKYMRSDSVIFSALRRAGVPSRRAERKLNGKPKTKTKAVIKSIAGTAKIVQHRKKRKKGRDMVASANAALRSANKRTGSVRHAVIALMKTLAHEEIHELTVDFNANTFHVKRVLVEEGKV